jgi:hypothetical protein
MAAGEKEGKKSWERRRAEAWERRRWKNLGRRCQKRGGGREEEEEATVRSVWAGGQGITCTFSRAAGFGVVGSRA